MYELKQDDWRSVSGGNGGPQVCSTLPGGGAQCTSTMGDAMVITSYDKHGSLVSTTTCTMNRSGSLQGGLKPKFVGEVRAGGGSSCRTTTTQGSRQRPGGAKSVLLLVEDPYQEEF
jgi:hypothetical protein